VVARREKSDVEHDDVWSIDDVRDDGRAQRHGDGHYGGNANDGFAASDDDSPVQNAVREAEQWNEDQLRL
jgi:hypothetical protein